VFCLYFLTAIRNTDARSSPDPRPVFHQQPAGLLQWHSSRHHSSADAEAADCPERRCPPDCRRQNILSRQSCTERPTLVASQTMHLLQALCSGLQVPPQHGPPYLSRVSCTDIVASQSSTAAIVFDKFTPRATGSHMLRTQEHRRSQSGSMERSTGSTH